jgi:hypothetical protein
MTAALPAFAKGEVTYDPAVCGGADFSADPTFSPATDLPYLMQQIGTYSANPGLLFYGPADGDPFSNWYTEPDVRDQLAKLAVMRGILDKFNLWALRIGPIPPAPDGCPPDAATVRQIDGTCNDLAVSGMGAAGARFGRNIMPLSPSAQPDFERLMQPNPRTISRTLLTREDDAVKTEPFLNLLATAWIQFQVHDWFNHQNTELDFWRIPLDPDDPLYSRWRPEMLVAKTQPDATRQPHEAILPPTSQNEVTHWWDASQIYGSDLETAQRLRSFEGGHLRMNRRGLLPRGTGGFADTGFRRNWWVGLSLMHTLFAKNHNWIADALAAEYPQMADDDQWLYDTARMINAAMIARIHTLEWTPAILPNPTLQIAMNANWDGLNQYFDPPLPQVPGVVPPDFEPIVFGVTGGERDLKVYPTAVELEGAGVPAAQAAQIAAIFNGDIPYALTEEFTAVYRMHPLLPEAIEVPGRRTREVPLERTRDRDARRLMTRFGPARLLAGFGAQRSGSLVLNNYPSALQNLRIPLLGRLDLGAVDILRDRERGVPRYNDFRRGLNLPPLDRMDQLTSDPALLEKLNAVYGGDIEQVDLMIGTFAEQTRPDCYFFGETLFQVFIGLATRRLQADRFYTDDFNAETYTPLGMELIRTASLRDVLLLHYPALAETGLADVTNAFFPWE